MNIIKQLHEYFVLNILTNQTSENIYLCYTGNNDSNNVLFLLVGYEKYSFSLTLSKLDYIKFMIHREMESRCRLNTKIIKPVDRNIKIFNCSKEK